HQLFAQKLRGFYFDNNLAFEISAGPKVEILMRRPAKAVGATVNAAAIAVDRIIERDIGTVVAADDRASFGFFKDFDLRRRRFSDPFDRVAEPRIWRIIDGPHACNLVLSMKRRITVQAGLRKSISVSKTD